MRHTDNDKLSFSLAVFGLIANFAVFYMESLLRLIGVTFAYSGPQLSIVWKTLAGLFIVAYIVWIEKLSLSSIGLRWPSEHDVTWAFYFWGISMGYYWVINRFFPQGESIGEQLIIQLHPVVVAGIIITSAVVEEIFFRGYLVERCAGITGRVWIGTVVSFCIFLIPHITFFGYSWLFYHGIKTVLIYVLYLWKRNLPAVMLFHLLGNLPIMVPVLQTFFRSI